MLTVHLPFILIAQLIARNFIRHPPLLIIIYSIRLIYGITPLSLWARYLRHRLKMVMPGQ